jgi:hypothetical protein
LFNGSPAPSYLTICWTLLADATHGYAPAEVYAASPGPGTLPAADALVLQDALATTVTLSGSPEAEEAVLPDGVSAAGSAGRAAGTVVLGPLTPTTLPTGPGLPAVDGPEVGDRLDGDRVLTLAPASAPLEAAAPEASASLDVPLTPEGAGLLMAPAPEETGALDAALRGLIDEVQNLGERLASPQTWRGVGSWLLATAPLAAAMIYASRRRAAGDLFGDGAGLGWLAADGAGRGRADG